MKIVVFDFEVFRYDVLLGAIVLDTGEAPRIFQTWDPQEIKSFYYQNLDAIWIGHNNSHYDNYILQAIIKEQDPYKVSKSIIERDRPPRLDIKLNYYDLMSGHFASLKVLEAFDGKNISESEVDFDMDRALYPEEREKVESYNRDDLDQTHDDLVRLKDEFQLRLDIIKEFHLPLDALHYTEAQVAAKALHAKKISDIENMPSDPRIYPNMQVTNKKAIDFYMGKSWEWRNKSKKSMCIPFCGTNHTIAAGGIHAGEIRHEKEAYYLDVSGYYNLIMINYNLLPRSIPADGKKLYEYMYHEQIRLKKINPTKRKVYKVILLAVFGAQSNQYCDFYDPNQGDLVRITGEMFLIDLLEKLEGKFDVIQSNTDGIMVKPLPGVDGESLFPIIEEWQKRTAFVLKVEKIFDIVQRDVNNYMYRDESGSIHTKGEAVKYYDDWKNPFSLNAYNSKEALIIHQCIVEYYMNGKKPEEVVDRYRREPKLFQYICKPQTYDFLTFEDGNDVVRLQKVNRCFAGKDLGMIYKNKQGKHDRYSSLPPRVFVHNDEILSQDTVDELCNKIDYSYYIMRAYERIGEFRLPDHEQLSLF